MNTTRLKWFAFMAALFLTSYVVGRVRFYSVREFVTSAQVYWRADQAVITVTTGAEVRREGLVAHGVRLLVSRVKKDIFPADLRVGSSRVYLWKNGSWQEQKFSAAHSPTAFPLWPYNGRFYTWDKPGMIQELGDRMLVPVPVQMARELNSAFPNNPDNFCPAGKGPAPRPYDTIQDAITREEWHSYPRLESLPGGKSLSFPVGDKTLSVAVQRAPGGEVSLLASNGSRSVPLFQAQAEPRRVSIMEFVSYARPLRPGTRRVASTAWLEFAAAIITGVLLMAFFLKPTLGTFNRSTVRYEYADPGNFPKLDRAQWAELTERIEALGFERLRDIRLAQSIVSGIGRVFLHPQTNVYASVHQAFAAGAPPLSFGFNSYLEDGWSLSHGVTRPTPGNVLTRIPRKLVFCCPGLSVEEVYAKHLADRDKVVAELGVAVAPTDSFATYEERTNQDAADRADLMRRSNSFVILVRFYAAKLKPLPLVWLGDYPKEVAIRTGRTLAPGEL